jgi:hypothetical protein
MIFNQVRDAMGDDAGFTTAGPGKQQQRAFHVLNGFALLWIEPCKKIHRENAGERFQNSATALVRGLSARRTSPLL